MLVSHSRKFIYLKTHKTAGTSVEIYFEPYCADPALGAMPTHATGERISSFGIVGYRGAKATERAVWYNHMSADLVKKQIGDEIWKQYKKFCVVRNPYDKVVSYWWWRQHEKPDGLSKEAAKTMPFEEIRKSFNKWVKKGNLNLIIDREIYTADGQLCLDFMIRYENLAEDMRRTCGTLDIEFDLSRLGNYKSHARVRSEGFVEYYDYGAAETVTEVFAFDFDHFHYPRFAGVKE